MAATLMDSIEVWDAGRTAAIAVPGVSPTTNDVSPYMRAFEVYDKLGDFGLDPSESRVDLVASSPPVVPSTVYLSRRRILRLKFADATFEEFRIVRFDRELSGESDPKLTLQPLWLDLDAQSAKRTLADGTVVLNWYRIGVSVSAALTDILADAPSYLVAGTVDASFSGVLVNIAATGSTHLALIRQLCAEIARRTGETVEWDIRWDGVASNYKIDITTGIGGTITHPIEGPTGGAIASKGNRRRMLKGEDARRYFSRVTGLAGPEGEQTTIAEATWSVSAAVYDGSSETTLTLDDDPIYVTNSPGTGGTQFGNATQGFFTVVSTATPDQVVVSGDASALNGNTGKFRISGPKDLTYIADEAAEGSAGVVERREERTDIPPARNLLDENGISSDFSSFTSGVPTGWNKSAGMTVAEETGEQYVQAGTKSVKLTGGLDEYLETDAVTLTPTTDNPYFAFWFAIAVASGRARIELINQTTGDRYPLNAKDRVDAEGDLLRALGIGGLTVPAGNYRIRITHLAAGTIVRLDSATLTQSVQAYEWLPDMGPEALWHACGSRLALEGGIQPDEFSGDWVDVSYLDGATEDEAKIGATVQLKDSGQGGSWDISLAIRLVELKRKYHGASFEKQGRLGHRAVDVSAFLTEDFRRRVLSTPPTPSMRAEFQNLSIGFDDDGYVLLSWALNGPGVKGYVNIGVASTPSAPTASSQDAVLDGRTGTLKIISSHADVTNSKIAAMGQVVHVKAIAENTLGHVTTDYVFETKRRRGDTQYLPPRVIWEWTRVGSATATLNVNVSDPSKAVTAIEFNKREGSESGDTFSGWLSTWDTSSGTPGTDTGLTRGENVSVEEGQESIIKARITFMDELGNSVVIADTFSSSNMDELTRDIYIDAAQLVPESDLEQWQLFNNGLAPRNASFDPLTAQGYVPDLPAGVEFVELEVFGLRTNVADTLSVGLFEFTDADPPVRNTIGTVDRSASSSYGKNSTSISGTVVAGYSYRVRAVLDADSNNNHVRLTYIRVRFTRPSYKFVNG